MELFPHALLQWLERSCRWHPRRSPWLMWQLEKGTYDWETDVHDWEDDAERSETGHSDVEDFAWAARGVVTEIQNRF